MKFKTQPLWLSVNISVCVPPPTNLTRFEKKPKRLFAGGGKNRMIQEGAS
jgi:hypothetical protein